MKKYKSTILVILVFSVICFFYYLFDNSPARAERLYFDGVKMYEKHQYPEALNCLNESIRIYPKHNAAIYYRGLCYYKLSFIEMSKIDKKNMDFSIKRDFFLKKIKEYDFDVASDIDF